MLSERTENLNTVYALAGTTYHLSTRDHDWNSLLNYQINYLERELNHSYGWNDETATQALVSNISRLSRQLLIKESYSYRDAVMAIFTLSLPFFHGDELYWLPSAG